MCAKLVSTESIGASGFDHFEHGADIGVRGTGATMASAFEQAAIAMSNVVTDISKVRARTQVEISITSPDGELLLVDFLNSIVYEMAIRNMLFSQFAVSIDEENHHLVATLSGEQIDTRHHERVVEVKGATLTELFVGQTPDGRYLAQCVVDV